MSSIRERLSQWSSCDVSNTYKWNEEAISDIGRLQIADGLSKLGHTHGGFLEGLTMFSPNLLDASTKIAGEVYTVKFVPKDDANSSKLKGNYVSQYVSGVLTLLSIET